MTQGTDFVLSALVDEGLDHLFMVPGGLVDPMLPVLAAGFARYAAVQSVHRAAGELLPRSD